MMTYDVRISQEQMALFLQGLKCLQTLKGEGADEELDLLIGMCEAAELGGPENRILNGFVL